MKTVFYGQQSTGKPSQKKCILSKYRVLEFVSYMPDVEETVGVK